MWRQWFFILVLTNWSSVSLSHEWQNPQYIENAFIEIALKSEFERHTNKVMKWQKPIVYQSVYLEVLPYPPLDEMIDIHMNHLRQITDHPVYKSNPSHPKTNLKIIITQDKNYQKVIQKYVSNINQQLHIQSNCMGQFKTVKSGEIIGATVIIPVDHVVSKGLLPACIVEELTQVMGLPNDSDWVNPSIANDKSVIELLSGLDYVFLKLLYYPEIKPGMNEQSVRKVIRSKISEMSNAGEVKKAQSRVNSGGLYRYIH